MENEKTMMSQSIGALSAALSKAQGEFDHAKKDVKNEFFKSKYADLASVIDAARVALSKNGLAVIQPTQTINGELTLVTILSHSSGEWIRGEYPIKPTKQDPQGFGSAMTYARRYAFSAITGIASEDDDGNAASQGKSTPQKPVGIVTNEQAVEIDMLMRSVGADRAKFLEVVKAESVETIPAANYSLAIELLNKKAAKNG